MTRLPVAIMGCGGFAREVHWALENGRTHPDGERLEPVAFVDLEAHREGLYGLPVVTLDRLDRSTFVICGIGGMPEIKQRVMQEAEAAGFRACPPVIFDDVRIGRHVTLGEGTVICAGNILTVDVEVGRHVAVNLDCTIGHDDVIGDFSTLSPGTHLSGNVRLEAGAYMGTGCAVIEGKTIGAYAVVGAGAVVTSDVPERSLVVGVPAKVKKESRALACAIDGPCVEQSA